MKKLVQVCCGGFEDSCCCVVFLVVFFQHYLLDERNCKVVDCVVRCCDDGVLGVAEHGGVCMQPT